MSSNNSTTSSNNNTNNNNTNSNSSSGLGAATYYGAVAVVVFILIALTITSRILYTRKVRRLAAQNSPDPEASTQREDEERLAMERRGEEPGLPTYRQSVLNPTSNTILDSTPLSGHPFPPTHNPSAETLPRACLDPSSALTGATIDPSHQPPKYEDPPPHTATLSQDTHNLELGLPRQSHDSPEMRMATDSTITLVLPPIRVHDVDLLPSTLPPTSDASPFSSPQPGNSPPPVPSSDR